MADYTNDIDRYLRGEMTPAEMNALEKKALHDPFLADALEGAQQLQPGDFAADLNQLQSALNARVHKRPTLWTWAGRIAAGLLLLALSTYVIVLITGRGDERPSGNLALNKKQEQSPAPLSQHDTLTSGDSATVPAHAEEPSTLAGEHARDEKQAESRGQEQRIARAPAEQPKPETESGKKDVEPPQVLADETAPEKAIDQAPEEQEIAEAAPEDSAIPAVKEEVERKKGLAPLDDRSKHTATESVGAASGRTSTANNVNRKIIRGKVTFAEDGMPLPGVNVLVKGSNEGTVTNSQGYYEIAVEETDPTLLFSFIGFSNKELPVKSNNLDVQLDADISELSEVVVVGYGADISYRSSGPAVMELATPEGGRKAFKQYLENNLQYPQQALKNEIEGKVTIQFSIGMTGQLSDFRVIKGIGYGCDDEVIRLIKSGPKWSPTKKNAEPIKDRVRVRMRFALPKK